MLSFKNREKTIFCSLSEAVRFLNPLQTVYWQHQLFFKNFKK